jgi:hypothetical protein
MSLSFGCASSAGESHEKANHAFRSHPPVFFPGYRAKRRQPTREILAIHSIGYSRTASFAGSDFTA